MSFNKKNKKIFVTGGAGFIGSDFILKLSTLPNCQILNFDKTYWRQQHLLKL